MLNFCLVHLCMNIKLNPNLKFESLKMKREENRKQQQEKNTWASSQTCGLVPTSFFFAGRNDIMVSIIWWAAPSLCWKTTHKLAACISASGTKAS